MKNMTNGIWATLLSTSLLLVQCKSASNVEPDDENELITTVQLQFAADGFTVPQTFTYRDTDGDGGNPATQFDTVTLNANTSYTLKVIFLDESKMPAVDISAEVKEKDDEHLVVITSSPVSLITYAYGDQDSNNLPLGLTGLVVAGAPGKGTLRVQLRHQPPVGGKIVKDGTPGPGSDDVNLDFNLVVK